MIPPNRTEILETIMTHRVSAIIRTEDEDLARHAMQAAVDGGFRIVEFTLTTPGALKLMEEFADKDLTVGAGTVLTVQDARQAVSAGACFLVSPIFDPDIVNEAAHLNAVSIPGTYTPTEMEIAHRTGADLLKVFPAPAGGVEFIRALRGPLPHLRLYPTAGPTPENFIEYLNAGCAGVGFVRSLFEPDDLVSGNFTAIRERAAGIVRKLAEATDSRPKGR